jgi:acyl-CoA dehydrogenase
MKTAGAGPVHGGPAERIAAVERIGLEVARASAVDVDARARFPAEALDALRREGLLGAAVPASLGGAGAELAELVRSCASMAQSCAASAMVLAMHHIQVLCLARHRGERRELDEYLRAVVNEQRLIASVTSEVGPSGDMRRSVAAVEARGAAFTLTKKATTLSYGAHADDLLITARRGPDAAPSDQVLVLALRGQHALEEVGVWETLGMRGTCSPGAKVTAHGEAWQILPDPFGEIATRTMVPASHLLWSASWLGIATDATAKAQATVRTTARKTPGVIPRAAHRLAELVGKLQLMRSEVFFAADEYDALVRDGDVERLSSLGFALRINNLKLSTSRLVVEIVGEALGICGIRAYRDDTPESLGRHLRDAHSAALMINNDRILETNAAMLLVHKGS